MKSAFGRMPYVDIIYAKADVETKKNLKLATTAFWECHVQEKYENNYVKSQAKHHRQLYCYGNCRKTDEFEVSLILFSNIINFQECYDPPLFTTNMGEICEPDEPRTRDGWLINSLVIDEESWEKPKPSRKIKNWSGCKKCWIKFCEKNPEYKT